MIMLAGGMLAACTVQSDEDRKIENAKAIARASMKDPSSVLFDNMRYVPSTRSVCGALNAKNSYGGYVGFMPFAVKANGELLMIKEGNSSQDVVDKYGATLAIQSACT